MAVVGLALLEIGDVLAVDRHGQDVGCRRGIREEGELLAVRRAKPVCDILHPCDIGSAGAADGDNAEHGDIAVVLGVQHFHHGLSTLNLGKLRRVEPDVLAQELEKCRKP